jgi:cytochrome c
MVMAATRGNWGKGGTVLLLVCMLSACGSPADPPPAQTESNGAAVAPATAVAPADGKPAAFAQCAACHAVVPGKNVIGPTLAGVFGRKAGSMPGFAYSKAMTAYGATWDDSALDTFLTAPMKAVPGTKMSYAGLSDGAQRKELIEYLKTLKRYQEPVGSHRGSR